MNMPWTIVGMEMPSREKFENLNQPYFFTVCFSYWRTLEKLIMEKYNKKYTKTENNQALFILFFRSTPHPLTVTTRIITFFCRESQPKPSFATIASWLGGRPNLF